MHGGPPRVPSAGDPSPGQDAGLHTTLCSQAEHSALGVTAQPSFPQHDDWGLNVSPWDIPQLSTYFLHEKGTDVMFRYWCDAHNSYPHLWVKHLPDQCREKGRVKTGTKHQGVCADHWSESLLGWYKKNRGLLSNRFGTQAKAFLRIMLGHAVFEDDCINIIFPYNYPFKYKFYCE